MVSTLCRHLTAAVCLVGLTACAPTVGGTDPATEPGTTDANRWSSDWMTAGEIRLFGGNFAPEGWAYADGRELRVNQYQRLFEVLGTTYGGDGNETFHLPDLPTVKSGNQNMRYLIASAGNAPRFEGRGEGLSEGLLGEIRLWPVERTPVGWQPCDGAELAIANHQALHAVLGTTYGGDGKRTFKLPNLPQTGKARYLINLAGQFPVSGEGVPSTDRLLGEIGLFAGPEAPAGFVFCDGQTKSIMQHTALYSILGVTYGGNSSTTFGLPKLELPDQPSVRYSLAIQGYYPMRP